MLIGSASAEHLKILRKYYSVFFRLKMNEKIRENTSISKRSNAEEFRSIINKSDTFPHPSPVLINRMNPIVQIERNRNLNASGICTPRVHTKRGQRHIKIYKCNPPSQSAEIIKLWKLQFLTRHESKSFSIMGILMTHDANSLGFFLPYFYVKILQPKSAFEK